MWLAGTKCLNQYDDGSSARHLAITWETNTSCCAWFFDTDLRLPQSYRNKLSQRHPRLPVPLYCLSLISSSLIYSCLFLCISSFVRKTRYTWEFGHAESLEHRKKRNEVNIFSLQIQYFFFCPQNWTVLLKKKTHAEGEREGERKWISKRKLRFQIVLVKLEWISKDFFKAQNPL